MSERPEDPAPKRSLSKPKRGLVIKADGSCALTSDEEDTLAEVLDEGATTFADMSARMQSFGRFVLREVFEGDAGAARSSDRGANPVWRELKRRAGGPTLKLDDKFLSVAVRIASWDRTIIAEGWRNLDIAHKALLLPLAKAELLIAAAKHVTDFKLDDKATET